MSLEINDLDWQESSAKEIKEIINEIAEQIARQYPDLFSSKKDIQPFEIVKKSVITRNDLLPEEQEEVIRAIMGQITGHGPLAEFFIGPEAQEVTEIAVLPTGEDTPPKVFYVIDGKWHESDKVYFKTNKEVEDYFRTHCENSDKELSADKPIVFAWMKDESRLTAIFSNVSHKGISGNIRKSPETRPPVDLSKLVEWGAMPDFVKRLVINAIIYGQAKVALCGRTDSGKTTFLRSMGKYINPKDRVIIAEKSYELSLPHLPHCLYLVEVSDGKKVLVDMTDLCHLINRSNPDHVIIGEILGKEIIAASQVAASTSGVFWVTLHAGNLVDFLTRMHGMFFEGGMHLDREFLSEKIRSMFNFLIFLDKDKDKKRTLMSIVEVTPDGYNTIVEFDTAAFIESDGKIRRWIYKNTITKDKLDELAFRGAKILPEFREIHKRYLTTEGEYDN